MPLILRENEKLIKTVKRHWVFIVSPIVSWILFFILVFLVRRAFNFDFFGYWPWVASGLGVIAVVSLLYKVFLWNHNILMLTDQRLVENVQRGLFSRFVTELLYRDILEVSYVKQGIGASICGYGDIRVRTAANSTIVLERVSDPQSVVDLINQIR